MAQRVYVCTWNKEDVNTLYERTNLYFILLGMLLSNCSAHDLSASLNTVTPYRRNPLGLTISVAVTKVRYSELREGVYIVHQNEPAHHLANDFKLTRKTETLVPQQTCIQTYAV